MAEEGSQVPFPSCLSFSRSSRYLNYPLVRFPTVRCYQGTSRPRRPFPAQSHRRQWMMYLLWNARTWLSGWKDLGLV